MAYLEIQGVRALESIAKSLELIQKDLRSIMEKLYDERSQRPEDVIRTIKVLHDTGITNGKIEELIGGVLDYHTICSIVNRYENQKEKLNNGQEEN